MPKKSALDPALRAALDQLAVLKREQRAEQAPTRKQRRALRKRVDDAEKSIARYTTRIQAFDAHDHYHGWFPGQIAKERAVLTQALADSQAKLQRATLDLELFYAIHADYNTTDTSTS